VGGRIVGRKINSKGKRDDYNKEIKISQYLEVREDQKANCMTTVYKDSVVPYFKVDKRLKVKFNQGKASCLTGGAHSGGNHSDMDILVIQKPRGFNKGGIKAKDGKTPTLSSSSRQYNNHLLIDSVVRRFTPIECERLQTVPDNYTSCVSNSQRYKMLGNGWTVDVIAHIFNTL
jgi:DNA (cytosine-5)-methyltransferase 3A